MAEREATDPRSCLETLTEQQKDPIAFVKIPQTSEEVAAPAL